MFRKLFKEIIIVLAHKTYFLIHQQYFLSHYLLKLFSHHFHWIKHNQSLKTYLYYAKCIRIIIPFLLFKAIMIIHIYVQCIFNSTVNFNFSFWRTYSRLNLIHLKYRSINFQIFKLLLNNSQTSVNYAHLLTYTLWLLYVTW